MEKVVCLHCGLKGLQFTCMHCGKVFLRSKTDTITAKKKGMTNIFCSRACNAARKKIEMTPERWEKKRAYDRDWYHRVRKPKQDEKKKKSMWERT